MRQSAIKKNKWFGAVLGLGMVPLLGATPAKAAMQLEAESPNSSVQAYLKEVEGLLPPTLKARMNARVQVKFTKFAESRGIDASVCSAQDVRLGRYRQFFAPFSQATYVLELNQDFLPVIAAGRSGAQKIACGHGDTYRLAIATALHEISHIYDEQNVPAQLDPSEKSARSHCSQGREASANPQCQALAKIHRSVSDRPIFQQVMGWSQGSETSRNQNTLRSPDPYEYADSYESFAVNMEHFLLDPEYQCRRPRAHEMLAAHFGYDPQPSSRCSTDATVYFSDLHLPVSMDPSRVYQVHYLFAAQGTDASSRWGHSMLRIVGCAPERKEVGPECLKDVNYHMVLSYRANQGGLTLDYLKGLRGEYPSQLFIFRMPEIISEYVYGENRDLLSVPLRLSEKEKRQLLHQALSQYWEYSGKYYFLSNNCASETLQLLQASLESADLRSTYLSIDTPGQLLATLERVGYADTSVLNGADAENRYRFSGLHRQIERSFEIIRSQPGFPADLDQTRYVESLKASDRVALFKKLKTRSALPAGKLATQFLFLEMRIREHLKEVLKDQATRLFEGRKNGEQALPKELDEIYARVSELAKVLLPWNLAKGGYGIPTSSERIPEAQMGDISRELEGLQARSYAMIREKIPGVYSDIDHVSENIQYFVSDLKADMKLSPNPNSLKRE